MSKGQRKVCYRAVSVFIVTRVSFEPVDHERVQHQLHEMAARGLRVLAFARKSIG